MMKLYLTTDGQACSNLGQYNCEVWTVIPFRTPEGRWTSNIDEGYSLHEPAVALAGVVFMADLAALGFPKPGKMRVHEIGECEEATR